MQDPCGDQKYKQARMKKFERKTKSSVTMTSTNSPERDALSEERELLDFDENEAAGNDSKNRSEVNDLRTHIMNMNSNFESVLKRLSKIEAATERPAKKRRVAERIERDVQPSEAEDDISDSEQLMPQIASGENGGAPDTNSSEAEFLTQECPLKVYF